MLRLGALQALVVAGYDRLGMPSWPNPHPGMALPGEEEYSRVTEPARYRIVHARARVWANRLGDVPGVEVETLAPAPLDDEGHLGRYDRGVRLTSHLPGTLALLLLERDVRLPGLDASIAVLHISVVRPELALEMLPDCGCDACDWGSGELLRAIDETIGHRDLEELLAERSINVDHVTVYRWVQRFTPLFVNAARPLRYAAGDRWFVDETYMKVAGRWRYLYRAVDQYGQVIDVLLSEQRDTAAARRFFLRALRHGPTPVEVTTDKGLFLLEVGAGARGRGR